MSLGADETLTMAEIEGPGVIRHIWVTVPDQTEAGPFVLRDLVLRMWWDEDVEPCVEVPLGDLFCCGFGARARVTSQPILVAPSGGMNCYFPMPFTSSARITLENQHGGDIDCVFFQIDYTLGDELPDDTGTFHAHWRRSNASTQLGEDHVILDGVHGSGAYVGTYVALTSLERFWWGEGEVKFMIDGDQHPTVCGTGLEDYVGGAWAFQSHLGAVPEPIVETFSGPYSGYCHYKTADHTQASPFATGMPPNHGMYRWHLLDPIYFHSDLAVTVQQIGYDGRALYERCDDISTTAYWYQNAGHNELPALAPVALRRPR